MYCGTDIIEVQRVQKAIESLGQTFVDKIFTKEEIEYCISKKEMQYQHFAARFAAKEAIFKAISPLLKDKYDITWKDAQICNDNQGRPYVELLNKKFDKIKQIDISISHVKEYAIATCIIELK